MGMMYAPHNYAHNLTEDGGYYAYDDRCLRCRRLMFTGQRWTRDYPIHDDEGEFVFTLRLKFRDGGAVAVKKGEE